LNAITEADIAELKVAGIQEGKTIEYKRDLPGTRDEDTREFLADASSFANTQGGDMLYGVMEDQGVIVDIPGVTSPDPDAEILRMENLILARFPLAWSRHYTLCPAPRAKSLLLGSRRAGTAPTVSLSVDMTNFTLAPLQGNLH
jgi:hypothetical protein